MNIPISIAALVVGSNSEVVLRVIAKDPGVQRSNSTSYFSFVGNDMAGDFLEVKCLNADGLHGKIREGHVLRFIGFVSIAATSHGTSSPFRKLMIYDAFSMESSVCAARNDGIPWLPVPGWWHGSAKDLEQLPLKVQRTLDTPSATFNSCSNAVMCLRQSHNPLTSLEEIEIISAVKQIEDRDLRQSLQEDATIIGFINDGWDSHDIETFKVMKAAVLTRINEEFYMWRAWMSFGLTISPQVVRMIRCLAVITLGQPDTHVGCRPSFSPALKADIIHDVIMCYCFNAQWIPYGDKKHYTHPAPCCAQPNQMWCKRQGKLHPICKICNKSMALGTEAPVCQTLFAHVIE